jgi:hypothetical protein
MKNLKIGDKIAEILEKNPKLSKRFLSAAVAAMLATAPAVGTVHAESESVTPPISLVMQEAEMHYMTLEEYETGVMNAYNELSKHINYEHMLEDVKSAFYLTNYAYINDELTQELIDRNYIYPVDMFNAEGVPSRDNPQGWAHVDNFNSLANAINDYNQSTIHYDWMDGTMSADHLIDPSVLCFEEEDRKDAHELFMKWFNGYDLTANTIIRNKSFTEAHKQLTELNAAEKQSEIFDSSVGARFMMWKITGKDMMQFLRDYMFENYQFTELDKYFKPDELRQMQLFLRDDFNPNLQCSDELEYLALTFGQEWHFCLDEVNKEMFTRLRDDEVRRDANAPVLKK